MSRIRQEETKEQREGRPWLPTDRTVVAMRARVITMRMRVDATLGPIPSHLFSAAIHWQHQQIRWQGPVLHFTSIRDQMQDQWEYRSRFRAGQKNAADFPLDFAAKIGIFDAFLSDYAGCAWLAWIRLHVRKLTSPKSRTFWQNDPRTEFLQSELSFLQTSRQSGLPLAGGIRI